MKKIKGNLVDMGLDGDFDVIIHGANCQQIMGAGIAKEIALKIPEAEMADKTYDQNSDLMKLSNWSSAPFRNRKRFISTVINLYTQYLPGKNLSMPALELGLFKLSQSLTKDAKIGIGRIGCGIAGGNWDEVQPLIEKYFSEHNLTIVEYEPVKKKKSKLTVT